MEAGVIIFISAVAYLIGLWILYAIIKAATKSEKLAAFSEVQMRLIAELLKQQGVSDERLREIINLGNKYFSK